MVMNDYPVFIVYSVILQWNVILVQLLLVSEVSNFTRNTILYIRWSVNYPFMIHDRHHFSTQFQTYLFSPLNIAQEIDCIGDK